MPSSTAWLEMHLSEGKDGAQRSTRRATQGWSTSQLRTCCRSDLATPFPPHFSGTHSGIISQQDPGGPPTQRAGQPAVITPCKCHLGLLIRPVSYRFNWFGVYHPEHTHICGTQRRGGAGGHLFIHSFGNFLLLCLFYSLFPVWLLLLPV